LRTGLNEGWYEPLSTKDNHAISWIIYDNLNFGTQKPGLVGLVKSVPKLYLLVDLRFIPVAFSRIWPVIGGDSIARSLGRIYPWDFSHFRNAKLVNITPIAMVYR